MPDVAHWFGSDLSLTASGDLVLTANDQETTQKRIVRRLMTALGGYIWHLDYGAGLPEKIGNPSTKRQLQAVVLGQMLLEPTVARSPPPVVTVTPLVDGAFIQISYNDKIEATPMALSLTIPAASGGSA